MEYFLRQAMKYARRDKEDKRTHAIGAVAIRRDGRMVHARNGAAEIPTPSAHAERRLLLKVDLGADVYVARARWDGNVGLARPCDDCIRAMSRGGVGKVYYTIADDEWGCLKLNG